MQTRAGYLAVVGAASLWAIGATLAGSLFDRGVSPLELTGARAWISAAGLALVVRSRPRPVTRGTAGPGRTIAFGLALVVTTGCYYLAIARLPVAIAIVLQYTAPAMVVLWLASITRRRPSGRVALAVAAAIAGVALLADVPGVVRGEGLRLDALGFAAAIGSAVGFASYIIIGEHMTRAAGPVRALTHGFGVAAVVWAIAIGSARGLPDTVLGAGTAAGVLFVGIGGTIAPFLLFLWGMHRIGASHAGIVATLEPVVAAVLAFVILDQSLGWLQIAGGVLVVLGIAVVQSERPTIPEVAPLGRTE